LAIGSSACASIIGPKIAALERQLAVVKQSNIGQKQHTGGPTVCAGWEPSRPDDDVGIISARHSALMTLLLQVMKDLKKLTWSIM